MLRPRNVLLLGLGSLAVTAIIGIYFIYIKMWVILPVGLLGVLLVLIYTPYLTRLPGITELVGPGLGFGLMALGTYVVQTETYSGAAIAVSLVSGLLIADLLLLNEFPDVEADKFAGRKHIPIVLNRGRAADIYCLILILVYALIIGTVAAGVLPLIALLGLVTLPLGIKAIKGVLRSHSDRDNLIPIMGMNVQVVLLTPLLMSTGILIGAFTFS